MIWRVFKKRAPDRDGLEWWNAADAAAESPQPAAIEQLRSRDPAQSTDEVEQREEMIEGLDHLASIGSDPTLPRVDTQHRVIGSDVCHFVAPATLVADVGTPGKLFLTSNRLVFSGGRVQAWPWHRLRDITRTGRELFVTIAGADAVVRLQCNTYGDAMVARHIALRILRR